MSTPPNDPPQAAPLCERTNVTVENCGCTQHSLERAEPMPYEPTLTPTRALYNGTCCACGKTILAGDEFGRTKNGWVCADDIDEGV